ncbi:MAG: S41 family peptidase [Kiloniellaceae bacterium]
MALLAASGPVVPAAAEAGDPVGRLRAAVAAVRPADAGLSAAALGRACGREPLCAARRLATAIGDGARLQRVGHPDTDTIRWVRTRPSLRAARRLADGRVLVVLDRFGRTVEQELDRALDRLMPARGAPGLLLDLRGNSGGDFGRMLRTAGALTGPRPGALFLRGGDARRPVDLPAGAWHTGVGHMTVLVGPRTASSGEVLAALLRRYAGAEVLGARTAGKDYLTRIVPVNHDWRLLIRAERIEIPGERLAGGLKPDRALPSALDKLIGP